MSRNQAEVFLISVRPSAFMRSGEGTLINSLQNRRKGQVSHDSSACLDIDYICGDLGNRHAGVGSERLRYRIIRFPN